MKQIILSCPTIQKELEYALVEAQSNTPVYFMPQTLHNSPPALGKYIQNYVNHLFNVDRVIVCASGCGGGTMGLEATTAEIVIPRTRDCLDILLSGESLSTLQRSLDSVFLTSGWWDFMKNSDISLEKLTVQKGEKEAKSYLKNLYNGFNHFELIDTGCFDIKQLQEDIKPFIDAVEGTVKVIPGHFGILRKIAQNNFDDDFIIVKKGNCLKEDFIALER